MTLRKLKGHGLLERDGRRYAYRLTGKGIDVALLFLLLFPNAPKIERVHQKLQREKTWTATGPICPETAVN